MMLHLLLIQSLLSLARAATPSPLPINPSRNWVGNDGPWSSINLGVGTSPQLVNVMPYMLSGNVWTVTASGCTGRIDSAADCKAERGGFFDPSNSTTYKEIGAYTLGIRESLGLYGEGTYGTDNFFLYTGLSSLTQQQFTNMSVVSLQQQGYQVGSFGLFNAPIQLDSTKGLIYSSPLTTLYNQSIIPSMAYGYNPGNYYRSQLTSLTLGGMDTSRSVASNVTFSLSQSNFCQAMLNKLTFSAASSSANFTSPFTVFDVPIAVSVDDTSPYMWLPAEACAVFESTLGLVYNSSVNGGAYLLTDAQHTYLQSLNLTFDFRLAESPSATTATTISIPYNSLELEMSYPTVNSSGIRYFPLKRAASKTQYTLGRSFLQEVYLIVDYDAGKFKMQQMNWTALAGEVNIVPVDLTKVNGIGDGSNGSDNGSDDEGGSKFPVAAIAGIVVAAVVVIAAIIGFLFWRRKKKTTEKKRLDAESAGLASPNTPYYGSEKKEPWNAHLDDAPPSALPYAYEVPAELPQRPVEMMDTQVTRTHEMEDSSTTGPLSPRSERSMWPAPEPQEMNAIGTQMPGHLGLMDKVFRRSRG